MASPEQIYLEGYESAKGALPGPWLAPMRESGMAQFRADGLPHRRLEAWKYTDLRLLLQQAPEFSLAAANAAKVAKTAKVSEASDDHPTAFDGIDAYRFGFVDGRLNERLPALPVGVDVIGLANMPREAPTWVTENLGAINPGKEQPVVALNAGLMQDGVLIRIREGVVLDKPLHLIFDTAATEPAAAHVRNLVVLEAGASAVILESYTGVDSAPALTNIVNEFDIRASAKLTRIKLLAQPDDHMHLGTDLVKLGDSAAFYSSAFTLGCRLARNEVHVRLEGEKAVAELGGAFLIDGGQHCDNTVVIDHAAPDCSSAQVFKGVLGGQARGVFQGKTVVHPGAQQTDAHQLMRALLLSERAEMDAKPELEIYADDVQCSHGATTGDIDPDTLFYMRSRGIDEAEARAMLIRAFLDEVTQSIADDAIREAVWTHFDAWLARL